MIAHPPPLLFIYLWGGCYACYEFPRRGTRTRPPGTARAQRYYTPVHRGEGGQSEGRRDRETERGSASVSPSLRPSVPPSLCPSSSGGAQTPPLPEAIRAPTDSATRAAASGRS